MEEEIEEEEEDDDEIPDVVRCWSLVCEWKVSLFLSNAKRG